MRPSFKDVTVLMYTTWCPKWHNTSARTVQPAVFPTASGVQSPGQHSSPPLLRLSSAWRAAKSNLTNSYWVNLCSCVHQFGPTSRFKCVRLSMLMYTTWCLKWHNTSRRDRTACSVAGCWGPKHPPAQPAPALPWLQCARQCLALCQTKPRT